MKHSKGKAKVHPIRKIHVAEEYAPENFFGRFDVRMNTLIKHLFEQGFIDDESDATFAKAIGRNKSTVFCWRTYRSYPNSVSLVLLHRTFGVDIHWLCGLRSQSLREAFDTSHTTGKLLAKSAQSFKRRKAA